MKVENERKAYEIQIDHLKKMVENSRKDLEKSYFFLEERKKERDDAYNTVIFCIFCIFCVFFNFLKKIEILKKNGKNDKNVKKTDFFTENFNEMLFREQIRNIHSKNIKYGLCLLPG